MVVVANCKGSSTTPILNEDYHVMRTRTRSKIINYQKYYLMSFIVIDFKFLIIINNNIYYIASFLELNI